MIDVQSLGDEFMLRIDHVLIAILRKARAHPVAGLGGFSVPDVVGQDDVILLDVEQPAGNKQHAGELRPQELVTAAACAMHDEHRVRDAARFVAHGRAQRRVMQAQRVERLAVGEFEILDDVVAFLGGKGRRGLRKGQGRTGNRKTGGNGKTNKCKTEKRTHRRTPPFR